MQFENHRNTDQKTINQLQKQKQQLSLENNALLNENTLYKEVNNRQTKEIDHLQDEFNEQTNKLKEILHRREELEEEVHSLKDVISAAKKEANTSRKETQLLLSDLETKNREIEVRWF